MKHSHFFILGLLLCSSTSFAQPVWSPETRAERETAWMRDSLNATEAQSVKIKRIELNYNKQIDQVMNKQGQTAKRLMRKKDKDMKSVLDRDQYARYYRREQEIREVEKSRKVDKEHIPL
jgi:hypothetical protein